MSTEVEQMLRHKESARVAAVRVADRLREAEAEVRRLEADPYADEPAVDEMLGVYDVRAVLESGSDMRGVGANPLRVVRIVADCGSVMTEDRTVPVDAVWDGGGTIRVEARAEDQTFTYPLDVTEVPTLSDLLVAVWEDVEPTENGGTGQ